MTVRAAFLDVGGVLEVGDRPLPGARAALDRLRASGLEVMFLTNTTRTPTAAVAGGLRRIGFEVAAEELLGAPAVAREAVLARGLRPLLLVHARLRPELADLEGDPPDSVLVGDAGDAFTYAALNRAFRVLHAGAPLLAMASNRYFQEADGLSLDAGPFVAALEHAAGTRAEVLGKPAATFFRAALARLGLDPEQAVMIGDDVEADVIGARAAGLGAVLVATGKHRAGDDERARAAGASCAANLAAAVDLLLRG